MRYLGNKTNLLDDFLLEVVEEVTDGPGTACDPFAGTAAVSGELKSRGWTVHSGDLLASSYALQVARVELDRPPRFPARLLDGESPPQPDPGTADLSPPASGEGSP